MKIKYPLFFILCNMLVNRSLEQPVKYSGWDTGGKEYLTVTVNHGKIENIARGKGPGDTGPKIYMAPGLIDTQVNGYARVSFSGQDLTAEGITRIVNGLIKEGVTTFFPTLITAPPEITQNNLKVLSDACHDGFLAHVMPGFFLEGPYISPEEGYRGVHDKNWIRPPDWNEFETFYNASGQKIIQVGLAPETDGALDFISKATARGIVISLAHHNADAATIRKAVEAGAKVSTPLGNGCANLIQRHNNPLWPQLANDGLTASIIADGHHLTPEELTVFYKVKGPDHLMLVSDITELAGMPPGEYEWDGKR